MARFAEFATGFPVVIFEKSTLHTPALVSESAPAFGPVFETSLPVTVSCKVTFPTTTLSTLPVVNVRFA